MHQRHGTEVCFIIGKEAFFLQDQIIFMKTVKKWLFCEKLKSLLFNNGYAYRRYREIFVKREKPKEVKIKFILSKTHENVIFYSIVVLNNLKNGIDSFGHFSRLITYGK